MTIRDAIDLLHGRKLYMSMGFLSNEAEWVKSNNEAIDMAISALEKQEGKKPSPFWPCLGKERTYRQCPVCGSTSIAEYCARCGQCIDWSDEHGAD